MHLVTSGTARRDEEQLSVVVVDEDALARHQDRSVTILPALVPGTEAVAVAEPEVDGGMRDALALRAGFLGVAELAGAAVALEDESREKDERQRRERDTTHHRSCTARRTGGATWGEAPC